MLHPHTSMGRKKHSSGDNAVLRELKARVVGLPAATPASSAAQKPALLFAAPDPAHHLAAALAPVMRHTHQA